MAAYMPFSYHMLIIKFIKSRCCSYTPFLFSFFSAAAYEQCFELSKCLIVCFLSRLLLKSPYFHLIATVKQQEGLGRLKTTTGTGFMFCDVKYDAAFTSILVLLLKIGS